MNESPPSSAAPTLAQEQIEQWRRIGAAGGRLPAARGDVSMP